jgi:hypothetical protein
MARQYQKLFLLHENTQKCFDVMRLAKRLKMAFTVNFPTRFAAPSCGQCVHIFYLREQVLDLVNNIKMEIILHYFYLVLKQNVKSKTKSNNKDYENYCKSEKSLEYIIEHDDIYSNNR